MSSLTQKAKPLKTHPLFTAINSGQVDSVSDILKKGADVNMRAPDGGKTPLHVATQEGFDKIVKLLITNKANVKAITYGGFTPLHVAAQNNRSVIIDLLVSAGADVNAVTKVGCTSLHEAAARGCKEAVVKLLELKANPNIKEAKFYLTAANLAHEKGHDDVREVLIDSMTYQQKFIQNVIFILFNWSRACFEDSPQGKFISELLQQVILTEDGDEVFKKVGSAIKASDDMLKKDLNVARKLLIQNMKKYNEAKKAPSGSQEAKDDSKETKTSKNKIKM